MSKYIVRQSTKTGKIVTDRTITTYQRVPASDLPAVPPAAPTEASDTDQDIVQPIGRKSKVIINNHRIL